MFGRSPVAPERRGNDVAAAPAPTRPKKSRRFIGCGMKAYGSSMMAAMIKIWTFVLVACCCHAAITPQQEREWRDQMRAALRVPKKLPALTAEVHGRFHPEPGIVAERVTYSTLLGLRVSAI